MVKEHALYDFNSFTCVKASFIIKGTNNLGECSKSISKECAFFFFFNWWIVPFISIRSSWLTDLFSSSISLVVFYGLVLWISVKGILMSSSIVVNLSTCFFSSVDLCCMYFEALLVGAYTFRTVMSLFVMFTWPFCNYVMFLFIPSNFTYSEVFFMW